MTLDARLRITITAQKVHDLQRLYPALRHNLLLCSWNCSIKSNIRKNSELVHFYGARGIADSGGDKAMTVSDVQLILDL